MIQGGAIIIADAKDMWGNVTNMGLGEHAVRTHAPPMFYDKKGNILRYVDFESGTNNYITFNFGTATIQRSTDITLTGNFSLKMDCPAFNDYSHVRLTTLDFHEKTVGAQCVFSASNNKGFLDMYITFNTGTIRSIFRLNYDFYSGLVTVFSDDHSPYYIVGTLDSAFTSSVFSTIKLIGDYSTGMYKSLLMFGSHYDLSLISAVTSLSNFPKQLMITIQFSYASNPTTLYVDNLILTENEL